MNFKVVGQINNKIEAGEIQYIAKVHLVGLRAKNLGLQAWTDKLLEDD